MCSSSKNCSFFIKHQLKSSCRRVGRRHYADLSHAALDILAQCVSKSSLCWIIAIFAKNREKKKQGSGFFDTFSILNSGWLRARSKWACFRFIFFMIGTKSHLILRLSQIFWHGVEKNKVFQNKRKKEKESRSEPDRAIYNPNNEDKGFIQKHDTNILHLHHFKPSPQQ